MKRLVFKIPIPDPDISFVLLSHEPSDYDEVVIVDAKKFYQLCLNGPHADDISIDHNRREDLKKKYDYADQCLRTSYRNKNPVPFADVTHHKCLAPDGKVHTPKNHIRFTDGITRTKWLIDHGCKAFPVKCDKRSKQGLLEDARASEELASAITLLD
jgi:hypothetical protein